MDQKILTCCTVPLPKVLTSLHWPEPMPQPMSVMIHGEEEDDTHDDDDDDEAESKKAGIRLTRDPHEKRNSSSLDQ